MPEERGFFHINLANLWPGIQERRGVSIHPDGSLTLTRVPLFLEVIGELPSPETVVEPGGVASDPGGDIYIADPVSNRIFKFDCAHAFGSLPCLGGAGSQVGQLQSPRGLLVGPRDTLYIADSANHRVLLLDLRTGQWRGSWGQPTPGHPTEASHEPGRFNEPWGLAVDSRGAIYVVERAGRRVQKFTPDGEVVGTFWAAVSSELEEEALALQEPTDVTVAHGAKVELLYVVDARLGKILVLDTEGLFQQSWDLPDEVEPAGIVVFEGSVYLGDTKRGRILQFDLSGEFEGIAEGYCGPVAGIGLGCDGILLVNPGGGKGLVRFRLGAAFVREGDFLAGPYEVSDRPTEWHRLRAFSWPLPDESRTQLFTYTTDDPLGLTLGPRENPFSDWNEAPVDELDLLILSPPARYLWIGGRLQGNGRVSPTLEQMQVSYPRDTYLRYLPAIYREDEESRVLLERALALFESVLGGIEGEAVDLPLLFDPLATPNGWVPWLAGWQELGGNGAQPPNWLPWLASWLAFDVSETWSEAQTRGAIAGAFTLYGRRGTIEGLRRYLKLYAGVEALIEEPARRSAAWTLGEASVLGFDTMLASSHEQGAVLTTTATLGESRLIENPPAPLFEETAHRFCVFVYRAELTKRRGVQDVKAVLEREKPAHTEYHLCVIEPRMRVGVQARVGIDTVVAGRPSGWTLSADQRLAAATVLADGVGDRNALAGDARVGRATLS